MRGFEARVVQGPDLFARNRVTLLIRDGDQRAFLMGDGTWVSVAEDVAAPADMGLILPAGSIEAIALAVAEYQGHTSHADTEARVLREWLAVERARVDGALSR